MAGIRKGFLISVLLLIVTSAVDCYPVLKKEAQGPEEALRQVRLFSPEFLDDMDRDSLTLAVKRNMEYLDHLGPDTVFHSGRCGAPRLPLCEGAIPIRGEAGAVILLESLVEQVGELGGYEGYDVLDQIEGDDLIGMEYVPPFFKDVDYQRQVKGKWVHRVIPSTTVAAENTGLVHIAPGHGPEDFELGKEFSLEPFCPVDESGRFTKDLPGRYAGMSVKEANKHIIEELKERGLMYSVGTLLHGYGHCWRCESGIIYRNTTQWFLKITQIKNLMLEEIEKIRRRAAPI